MTDDKTDKVINATIDILGKIYPVRCPEAEVDSLQEAAAFLNKKMSAVQESGKVINLERIAIITALNMAHELLLQGKQEGALVSKINHRISALQDKLDTALTKPVQTELIYSAESDGLSF